MKNNAYYHYAYKMRTSSPDPYQKAQKTALSILARRRHSRSEVHRKLSARGFETEIIERVLAACERLDYIDDDTTASFFVEELLRKQVGLQRIRQEMKNRGFAPDLIQRVIDEHHLREREPDIAKLALEKKAGSIREKDPWKRREKLVRFLRSRGFRSATVSALFDRFGPGDDS